MKKQTKPWRRFRHRVVFALAAGILRPLCQWRYGIRPERFRQQGQRPYLILFNHQTPFDQFFVCLSFRGPIYFIATEDIFSLGWVSSLISYLVAPIPIKKQSTDLTAVKTCIRVAREGGSISLAPEGNRTYSGKTEYMNPAIATLARKLKLPIALYRIEGGYGSEPRWSDKVRRGKMRGYVAQVIEPEEYADLTGQELYRRIQEGLFVDEGREGGLFRSEVRAEYLERAVYVCPFCGLSKFESHGNEVECLTCHRKIHYGADKRLTGVGFDFPFPFTTGWYDYQKEFVNTLDLTAHTDAPLFTDRARMSRVLVKHRKIPLRQDARLCLYGDRITVDEEGDDPLTLSFADIRAIAVLGRNKLNVYHGEDVYQFKGDKRFNALKYVNLCFRCQNIMRGDMDGKFLGL